MAEPFSPPWVATASLEELARCIVTAKFIELCHTEPHPSPIDELEPDDAPDQSDGDGYGDHVRRLCVDGCDWCELDAIEAASGEWFVVV